MARAFKSVAVAVARVADERKAEQIQVLDVRKTSNVVDYLVVVTALSRPHIEALEQKIVEALEESGLRVHHRSRPQTDAWRVLDFGGVMVHLMSAEARELYALDRLHDGAKEIAWQN
ncbi:MAG: ribosome silencing factor [Elusimicrobia bacterium]|nr:ribosome silencing factor [Elusimicrobiota bacterium]MDE2509679.1 ribosome silencing factor [Elusimicrobiota bacterium]